MTDKQPTNEFETMIPEDSFSMEQEDISSQEWKDAPSDDGFSDPEITQEDFQDPVDVQEEPPVAPTAGNPFQGADAPKGRGNSLMFGVGGIGLILVGVMAYMQFGQSQPSQQAAPLVKMADVKSSVSAPDPQAEPVAPTTAATDTDMALLYRAAKQDVKEIGSVVLPGDETVQEGADKDELAGSTDVVVFTGDAGAGKPAPKNVGGKQETQPPAQVAKVENIPVKPATPEPASPKDLLSAQKNDMALLEGTIPPQSSVMPPPAAQEIPLPMQKEMEARIAQMENRLASQEKELSAARAQLLEAAKKNDELMQKLQGAEMRQATAQKSAPLSEPSSIELLKPEEESKPAVQTAKPSKAKKVVKKKTSTRAKASEPKAESLVLRAATPDAAWVASGKTTDDLRRVVVGDTLPSIGSVTEIRNRNGRWEVVGTKGVLR